MVKQITQIRSMSTFILSFLYLSNLFLKSEFIYQLCFILMITVILFSLPAITGIIRVIGYAALGLSILLFLIYQAPLSVWREALMGNLYLVALFTMVPILSIPIQQGGYYPALQSFFQRYVYNNKRYYAIVSFTSAFVGVLVNLAVVPLVYEIVQASEISQNKKLMNSAISRGFTTCMIWAPTTAAVALVIKLAGATWGEFFPYGILSGLICGVVGYVMTMVEERNSKTPEKATIKDSNDIHERRPVDHSKAESGSDSRINQNENLKLKKLIELSAFSIVLITSIVVISFLTGIQTVIIVSLAGLVFPFIWMGLIGRLTILMSEIKTFYFKNKLTKLSNEIVLFVGAGMFAESINFSKLGNYIPMALTGIVGDNVFLLSVVVIYGSILLSAVGVHPIILITIIGGTVKAADFGVSPTYIAILLSISWSLGITLSPTSPTVITLAGLSSRSPLEVGLQWNGLYVLISASVLIIFFTGLRMAGWL